MFKHVMVPTDGSEHAMHAARIAVDLAKQAGASVYGFHVLPPLDAVSSFADLMLQTADDDYLAQAVARAKQHLGAIRSIAEEAGVAFDGGYAFDRRPYTAIIGTAHQRHCDLIVMGTHGRTGFDRLVLGSETHKLLDSCDIPVLVCH